MQSLGGAQDLLSPPAYYHIYGGRTAIGCVVFSPDGSTLAGGELDGRIRLWNVSSGKDIRSFMGHQGYVWDVAFSPDGGTLASGSQDRTSKLWEISSGKEIRALQGHHGEVGSVVFSPDGTILTSGSWDKTTKVWDVSTGSEIQSLEGLQDGLRAENSVGWATPFSPDGTTLATGSRDKTIKLWDVSTGKEIRSLTGHQGLVTDIAFSPDGAIMASGSEDKTIKLWDLSTGRETHSLEGHRGKVLRVVFSPDGAILASGSYGGEGTVKLWDVSTGKEIHSLEGYSGCESLAFSPDGMNIASREIANIVVYEVFTGKELYQLGHQGFVTCMNFSPDGTILASGSYDNTIKLWDTSTGKEIQSLEGHQGEVYSISFSPDGGTLASGSEDKTIKLWPIDTSPLDLASYLDPRNPWCRLEGSKIVLTAPSAAPDKGIEFKYTNVLPFSHVGILRSARSQEEKNRALFWSYLHAESWNSAGVLYARLTDPASKESAREMTVLKRAAKAQSASDRGLDHHAGWHLEEITPLLKPEETDPAMLKAKALIKRLNDELEKRKTSDGRKAEPK